MHAGVCSDVKNNVWVKGMIQASDGRIIGTDGNRNMLFEMDLDTMEIKYW